jgi:hypothetical protein
MSENLLKYIIYASGFLCLYAFIAVRVLPMFNLVLEEDRNPEYFEFTKYGEQYYSSYIRHFREDMPAPVDKYRLSDRNPDLHNCDMIAFGDSFFDFSRQKTVAERLHDSLGIKVHSMVGFNLAKDWYPLIYLTENKYQSSERKYLIYQVVERNIHNRFIEPHELHWKGPRMAENGKLKPVVKAKDWIFNDKSEELYNVLLKGSYLTTAIYSTVATVKFNLFGYISSQTPVYDLDNFEVPMLFWDVTVNEATTSFYFERTDEMITTYCEHIQDLSKKVSEIYNLEMIFLPVPNKFTLYHRKVRPQDEYDRFLPRLFKAMDKYHINYVNIYDEFLQQDSLLYYGTDSHWNNKGVSITVSKLLEKLKPNQITFVEDL